MMIRAGMSDCWFSLPDVVWDCVPWPSCWTWMGGMCERSIDLQQKNENGGWAGIEGDLRAYRCEMAVCSMPQQQQQV
jgi:hypothetical protein